MKKRKVTKKQAELAASWSKMLEKYDRPLFGTKQPVSKFRPLSIKYDYPGRAELKAIKSVETGTTEVCAKRSVMDPRAWVNEDPATVAEIVAKSTRVAPAFNKGGYVYLTEETDPTTIGRK